MVGPLLLSSESKRLGINGTEHRQQPPNAWHASFGLDYSDPPILVKLLSALFHLGITH
jgi:hypothetical protein